MLAAYSPTKHLSIPFTLNSVLLGISKVKPVGIALSLLGNALILRYDFLSAVTVLELRGADVI